MSPNVRMLDGLRVRMIAVVDPLTVKRPPTSVSAVNAVRTLAAHKVGVSLRATATEMALGDPVMPAEVTVTVALPAVVTVPAAVAVSTCSLPATYAVEPVVEPVRWLSDRTLPEAEKNAWSEYATVAVSVLVSGFAPICTVPTTFVLDGMAFDVSPVVALMLLRFIKF